jgi:hypothetical protein
MLMRVAIVPVEGVKLLSVVSPVLVVEIAPIVGLVSAVLCRSVVLVLRIFMHRLSCSKIHLLCLFEALLSNI